MENYLEMKSLISISSDDTNFQDISHIINAKYLPSISNYNCINNKNIMCINNTFVIKFYPDFLFMVNDIYYEYYFR